MTGHSMNSDHYAHLLTAALTEPGALSFGALHESIDQQVEESEPATWEWIAAVRRVQQAGQLTREQADAMVVEEFVFSWNGQFDEKAALLSSLDDEASAEGARAEVRLLRPGARTRERHVLTAIPDRGKGIT